VTVTYVDGSLRRTTKPTEVNLLAEANIQDDIGTTIIYREIGPNPLWLILRSGALIILPLIAITAAYVLYIGRVNAAKKPDKS
jgi:hypothetical protein